MPIEDASELDNISVDAFLADRRGIPCLCYVEQALAPVFQPGDVVVMDDLAEHK